MPAYETDGFAPAAPVARVVLRHPDSGASLAGVPMLIDSGADATLLPRSAVALLGLAGTGEVYQLEGFDGTPNESEAVLAVLVFLSKTFRGRFLQVESEVGVMGRNILNRIPDLARWTGMSLGRIAPVGMKSWRVERLPKMDRMGHGARLSPTVAGSPLSRLAPRPWCGARRAGEDRL